jgi:hypothetical protein
VSSSTVGIVSCMLINPPRRFESLGGKSFLSLGEVVKICTGSLQGKQRPRTT